MSEASRPRKVLIVGAGPVGALTALSLHKRGWQVELWESRDDPRHKDIALSNLRSINLAISARGIEALRSVDPSLAEQFLNMSIPMKGRMIHHGIGKEESQLYDPIRNQSIRSCSRPLLNQKLVEALPSDIQLHFNTKVLRIDFEAKVAYGSSRRASGTVPGDEHVPGPSSASAGPSRPPSRNSRRTGGELVTPFDLVIGCDGCWSKVRSEMMRAERINFSQSFIPHAYIELHMPPDPNKPGGFAMDKNHLHIWPRHSFMLIGLPNLDGSFTLTLFLPFSSLETLRTREDAGRFFRDNFQSAVDIVGEERLVDDFQTNPRGSLVTINVHPSSWSSHAVLLGDASHCMVPFYGQGLNCGLEDVRVFNSFLEKHNISPSMDDDYGETDETLAAALRDYSDHREEDLKAICHLALDNYAEMRSHVLSPMHHFRRFLDSVLSAVIPSHPVSTLSLTDPFPTKRVRGWTSLYELVTFRPDVGYSEALRREQWQKQVVAWAGWTGGTGLLLAAGIGVLTGFKMLSARQR
ncbi:hypothetical protein BD324DRAFT_629714 [Kockovaella imperatae]|uniref:Kynurenine 3-monooxygenase n=1 Tax=Kockovaella imperatae TaxID=4999 RepID=A0A1Y1UD45_9TREE|nr:hypothetical protein BD324DRAFT_629714 [Kockovaella imperatae]ORX35971.1 hypothetical protein BD324DRAFT_629714 [Kockovaella imperatae]